MCVEPWKGYVKENDSKAAITLYPVADLRRSKVIEGE